MGNNGPLGTQTNCPEIDSGTLIRRQSKAPTPIGVLTVPHNNIRQSLEPGDDITFHDPITESDLLFGLEGTGTGPYDFARRANKLPNRISISSHGNPHFLGSKGGKVSASPKELADRIRNLARYTPTIEILLKACNVGRGPNCYAQCLADELVTKDKNGKVLKNPVIAPDAYYLGGPFRVLIPHTFEFVTNLRLPNSVEIIEITHMVIEDSYVTNYSNKIYRALYGKQPPAIRKSKWYSFIGRWDSPPSKNR